MCMSLASRLDLQLGRSLPKFELQNIFHLTDLCTASAGSQGSCNEIEDQLIIVLFDTGTQLTNAVNLSFSLVLYDYLQIDGCKKE